MELRIHGKELKITPAMKDYVKEKVERILKYIDDKENVRVSVMASVKKFKQSVEITIPLKSFIIRAEETQEDFYAAVDKAVDKLQRQIRKQKTRLVSKKLKEKTNKDFILKEIETVETEKNKVVKRKKIEVKPMNEDEAILQMELLGHEFYLYIDEKTDKSTVVYKRKDGNYGIISAE